MYGLLKTIGWLFFRWKALRTIKKERLPVAAPNKPSQITVCFASKDSSFCLKRVYDLRQNSVCFFVYKHKLRTMISKACHKWILILKWFFQIIFHAFTILTIICRIMKYGERYIFHGCFTPCFHTSFMTDKGSSSRDRFVHPPWPIYIPFTRWALTM